MIGSAGEARKTTSNPPEGGSIEAAASTDEVSKKTAWRILHARYASVRTVYPDPDKPPTKYSKAVAPFADLKPRCGNPLEEQFQAPPFRMYASNEASNLKAGLIQVCGTPAIIPCQLCGDGKGRWTTCVVCADHSPTDALRGACACCHYNGRGSFCSFKKELAVRTMAIAQKSLDIVIPNTASTKSEPVPAKTRKRKNHSTDEGERVSKKIKGAIASEDQSGLVQQTDRCHRCERLIPLDEVNTHKRVCEMWFCWTCKGRMPKKDRKLHLQGCGSSATTCGRCRTRVPRTQYTAHLRDCAMWFCRSCKISMAKKDSKEHSKTCGPQPTKACAKCRAIFVRADHEVHYKECKMWRCRRPGCGKIMPVGDQPLHLLLWDPDLKRCRDKHEDGVKLVAPPVKLTCYKCHKKVPNLDEHILTCGFWRCPRCQRSHIVANKVTHTEECTKAFPAWCRHCFRYMSPPDFKRHRGACSFQMCPQCRSRVRKEKIDTHIEECRRTVCSICRNAFDIDQTHECLARRCPVCLRNFHRDKETKHVAECTGPKPVVFKYTAAQIGREAGPTSRTLLSPSLKYPLLLGCKETMIPWLEQPANTMVADFEFFPLSGGGVFPLQIAIADGYCNWIIPPTNISYETTKGELLERAKMMRSTKTRYMGPALINKFHPGDRDDPTEGLTFVEIGDIFEQYVEVHGAVKNFISWDTSKCDYTCLSYILNQANKQHLLPPILGYTGKPIAWWRHLRRNLGSTGEDMSLCLSHLYWTVLPEDRALALRAHDAGCDVIMAYRLVFTYLRRALGMPLPGKIESLFSTDKCQANYWRLSDGEAKELLARLQTTPLSVLNQTLGGQGQQLGGSDEAEGAENFHDDIFEVLSEDEGDHMDGTGN